MKEVSGGKKEVSPPPKSKETKKSARKSSSRAVVRTDVVIDPIIVTQLKIYDLLDMYREPLQYPLMDRLIPQNSTAEFRQKLDVKYQEVIRLREECELDLERVVGRYGSTEVRGGSAKFSGFFYRLGKGNLMKHVVHRRCKIFDYEDKEILVSYWGQTVGEKCTLHGIGLAVTESGNLIEASFD